LTPADVIISLKRGIIDKNLNHSLMIFRDFDGIFGFPPRNFKIELFELALVGLSQMLSQHLPRLSSSGDWSSCKVMSWRKGKLMGLDKTILT
jgi:hypothetical protein